MSSVYVPNMPLAEILCKRSVPELRKMAREFYIKGTSKMKKAELLDGVLAALKEPERLRELLLVIDANTWQLFRSAAEHGFSSPTAGASPQHLLLEELGYVYCNHDEISPFLSVPAEIRNVYETLCEDGFLQQKARCDLLHSFVQAAINLYGIIEQDEFVALFNAYNEEPTSVEELFNLRKWVHEIRKRAKV